MADDDAKAGEFPADGAAGLERALMRPRTARFALWQALLAVIGIAIAFILFGSLVLEGEERHANPIERAARAVASGPITANQLVTDIVTRKKSHVTVKQRFGDARGFQRGPAFAPSGEAVLLSRFDGDENRGVVDLLDLDSGEIIHSWRPDIDSIHAQSKLPEAKAHLKRDYNKRRYVYHAPIALPDGSLIFNGMGSPLVKVDACGRPDWIVDGVFHHSIEMDDEGTIWSAERLLDESIRHVDDAFQNDALAAIAQDGSVLLRRSVAQMLIDDGLDYIVYSNGRYIADPIHLNDVQPVPGDGPFWKKGDVFLSLRSPSMVLLYRPSTDEIVWRRQGPWLLQHDVDILSDHEIAVFDNNAVMAPSGARARAPNEVVVYDFQTDETRTIFADALRDNQVRTDTNGLFDRRPDGSIMVEEHNFGRLIAFEKTGAVKWTYINRAPKDGRTFHLGWSRALDAADAAALKAALASVDCGAQQ